jgi:rhodanese-related sulfurtransferase
VSTSVITPVELKSLQASEPGVHIIDVRTGAEFESAHIAGSHHVPLGTLGEHSNELIAHIDRPVVLVCASGGRAEQAGKLLAGSGLDNVQVLTGGIGSWLDTGGDVVRGRQRWNLERQVRLVAGLIVLISVVVSFAWGPARILAGLIGAGLAFAAITNTCGMAIALSKLPYNRGATCDVRQVIEALGGTPTESTRATN